MMRHLLAIGSVLMLFSAVLASPTLAGDPADDQSGTASEETALGEEVNRICFPRNIRNWRTAGDEDNVLLIEERFNRWFRVELNGPCDHFVLRRALSISIESRPAAGCIRRGDFIIVRDNPSFTRRCAISKINQWNEDVAEKTAGEDASE